MDLPDYKSLSPEAIHEWFTAHGEPAFRAKQVGEWLWRRWAVDFQQMTNLSKGLRDALTASFRACSVELEGGTPQAAPDGTRKYLFRLHDGQHIETVLIPALRRHTICISTQVGCPVRCVFCASGRQGLARDLTAAEIIDQVVYVCHDLGERADNIVVMGMGEPLLNLDNLIPALECISDPERLGFGARHITVSTSGIVPGIRRLSALERQWNLALSLHAANEDTRRKLIPDPFRHPIPDIMEACREYREKCGRMVTLEYILIQGRNDGSADLAGLTRLARDLRAKVNLIPYNATSDGPFRPPDKIASRRFADALAKAGVQVSLRREMGGGIDAACGQLRARHEARHEFRREAPPEPRDDGRPEPRQGNRPPRFGAPADAGASPRPPRPAGVPVRSRRYSGPAAPRSGRPGSRPGRSGHFHPDSD
ncbi:MAG: 23S rRNA (adenine(2503)-C(2))-methyltransferase RlmN [Lentisphaeria bacterium]